MKKIIIIPSLLMLFAAATLIGIDKFGDSINETGIQEASWLTTGMWKANYYNQKSKDLTETDRNNLKSLMVNSSKFEDLHSAIESQRCSAHSEQCYLNELSSANIDIDHKDLVAGIEKSTEAIKLLNGSAVCKIAYDLSVLKFKIITLSFKERAEAEQTAGELVAKIKQYGGLTQDLRTPSCDTLASSKPEYFHMYVMMVAHLMKYGDDNSMKASAYITGRAMKKII